MTVLPPFAYLAATLLQAPQAVVTGTIRDQETGAPIAGAEVVLSDLSRVTTADAEGRYLFVEVPAGPQHLAVRFIGYAPRVMHALVPREGTLQITIALHPSPRQLRTIEVRPPLVVRGLEADTTSLPGRALSIAAIRNHPLLAEPDALEALAGGGVVLQPESPGGVPCTAAARTNRLRAGWGARAEPLSLGRPVHRVESGRAGGRQPVAERSGR